MPWYPPKYYAELRKLCKLQAASDKQQAINETVPWNDIEEAQPKVASRKRQASSTKRR